MADGQAFENVPRYNVLEPVSNINEPEGYAILRGPQVTTYLSAPSANWSDSSMSWQINVPTPLTVMDRRIYCAIPIYINATIAALPTPPNLAQVINLGFNDGLRAYPLMCALNNLSMIINQTNINIVPNDLFPYLMWYGTQNDEEYRSLSTGPTFQDQVTNATIGSSSGKNPYMGYEGSRPRETTRGEFGPVMMVNNSNSLNAQLAYVLYTPLFMSPLIFGNMIEPGFIGIRSLFINLLWGDLTRIWETRTVAGTVPYSTFKISTQYQGIFGTAVPGNVQMPTLYFRFMSLNPHYPIKSSYTYSYFQPVRYVKTTGSISYNMTTKFTSDSYTLAMFPERIYIFLSLTKGNRTYFTSDTLAPISAISIQFDNVTGILSNATQHELYNLSVENGLQMTWGQFSGTAYDNTFQNIDTVGSLICLRIGKDIALAEGKVAGLLQQVQFQIDVTFTNNINNTNGSIFDLNLISIYPGTFTLSQSGAITQTGIVSEADAMNNNFKTIPYRIIKNWFGGGSGSFWTDAKGAIGKTADFVRDGALPAIDKGREIYGKALNLYNRVRSHMPKRRKRIHGGKLISLNELSEKNDMEE